MPHPLFVRMYSGWHGPGLQKVSKCLLSAVCCELLAVVAAGEAMSAMADPATKRGLVVLGLWPVLDTHEKAVKVDKNSLGIAAPSKAEPQPAVGRLNK